MGAFGKREMQIPDWFETGITNLDPETAAKRKALTTREIIQETHLLHSKSLETMQNGSFDAAQTTTG